MITKDFSGYNKTFPRSRSIHYLNEAIEQRIAQGWEMVGEIKQNYLGEYSCMMVRKKRV